jgi:integral membrane protein
VQGALIRYRIIAWIVGVVLIVLVFIGMPLKYIGDNDAVVAAVGPAHGFLFIVYLVATFDLGRRAKWPLSRMLLVMLAGTIPFLSFWAERKVSRSWIGDSHPALVD